jgi:hypothetical protein
VVVGGSADDYDDGDDDYDDDGITQNNVIFNDYPWQEI